MKKIYKILIVIFLLIIFSIILTSFLYVNKINKKEKKYFRDFIPTILEKKSNIFIEKRHFLLGDSLFSVLKKLGLSEKDIFEINKVFLSKINTKAITPLNEYEIEKYDDGKLRSFSIYTKQTEKYRVKINYGDIKSFSLYHYTSDIKIGYKILEGEIRNTLYDAIIDNGGTPSIAIELSEIFAWQIDFLTDPRVGDKFFILFQYEYSDIGYYKFSKILLAKYIAKNNIYEAFFYKNGYFDSDGKAMQKFFLKSPLRYKRISSYFTTKRMHPILKYVRPHLGIDYAAPRGTPIVSVGDGTVFFKGKNGGFGNLLKIKHPNGYESWYGHLNGYAKGINVGTKVKQGQTICYVGSTGLATGPHLDFRFKKNGIFINYLSLKIPTNFSLSKNDIVDFKEEIEKYNGIINNIKNNIN